MSDSSRIDELRRRVQTDPTSIAFAQLAEELRRAGANEEAVGVCRVGLARHAGYLSARVTLGRALIEIGRLDEALAELTTVAAVAPDNLAAMRGLAEIHQRRGDLGEALEYYRRALDLARHDPELEEAVERMAKEVTPPEPAPEAPVSIEALFDFDALVEQLGAEDAGPPAIPSADEWERSGAPTAAASALPAAEPAADGLADTFAALEQDLRAYEAPREPPAETPDTGIAELERWLVQIEDEVR